MSSIPGTDAAFALLIVAACAGFVVWNWHPAKIFLGDIGSVPLGFLLGWLLLALAARGPWEAALILPLYYLADATLTLLRRGARGEKVWQAHREHFYQQAVQNGRSHARVSLAIAGANAGLLLLALLAVSAPENPAIRLGAVGVAAALVILLLMWMKRPG